MDVRLIAATNRDLRAALEEGTFREDLYYRLNVVAIDIPPLRDHKEDIPALGEFFPRKVRARIRQARRRASRPQAMKLLMDFHWPGNVRELENILARASRSPPAPRSTPPISISIARARALSADAAAPVLPEGMTLEQWEDEIIREALRRANGNKSQAARALGLSRNALRYRLSKMGVADPPEGEGT